MAINNYFNSSFNGLGEQSLISSLMRESIQVNGYDISYMPRESVALDYLFGEDVISTFKDAIPLECYIKDYSGYSGNGHILSKFGLDVQDDLTIQIHIDRFKEEISTRFSNITRPREGDLIYFGLDKNSIFEISFVDNKVPFFQAGALYIYELNLKRFVFGGENIETGVTDIDDIVEYGDIVDFELGALVSVSTRYSDDEVVYQSTTGLLVDATATAEVVEQVNNTLSTRRVKGTFVGGLNIIGEDSGTVYTFPIKSDNTFDDSSNNKMSDNINIRKDTNNILDFDEQNPFLDTGYN